MKENDSLGLIIALFFLIPQLGQAKTKKGFTFKNHVLSFL
jgi:hypothetical protein